MRAFAIALPMALALSACGGQTERSGEASTSSPDAGQAIAASQTVEEEGFEMKPGLYAIEANGTIYAKTRLNPDFTYVDYSPQNVTVGGGTWEVDGATFCFNPRGENGEVREPRCWKNGPAGDGGSFSTTLADGSESYFITPLSE